MSRRTLWLSCGSAVVIGALGVFALLARDRAPMPAPAGRVDAAPSVAPTAGGPATAAAAPATEPVQEPAVGAAPDPRLRQVMRMLIHNERDEAGRQVGISRVRAPLADSEKQAQLEIDEAEAEREARSLGLADSDFIAARLAELTPTRDEDAGHFARRVSAEERALLADEYLTAYFMRRYLAANALPNGMPMPVIYNSMRGSVLGLTPEQRADALAAAHHEFGELPSEPTYSEYPAEGWNHPPAAKGG
jgi:hypothetical protein